jgi:hypothetical protein
VSVYHSPALAEFNRLGPARYRSKFPVKSTHSTFQESCYHPQPPGTTRVASMSSRLCWSVAGQIEDNRVPAAAYTHVLVSDASNNSNLDRDLF